jgi:hypothetical protein
MCPIHLAAIMTLAATVSAFTKGLLPLQKTLDTAVCLTVWLYNLMVKYYG